MPSSNALIRATTLPIRLSSRSLRVPKIFFTVEISMRVSLAVHGFFGFKGGRGGPGVAGTQR